ncbi:MAG: radical SAM protein [Endomicrobiia bacterium]
MFLYERIEYAKELVNKKMLREALKEFQSLISIADDIKKESIYFEIGKIYTMLNENLKAKNMLVKIKHDKQYKQLSINLLLDNYKKLAMKQKILNLYKNLVKENEKIPTELLGYVIETEMQKKKYKEALKIISKIDKKEFEKIKSIVNNLYIEVTSYIKKLNLEGKHTQVKKLYLQLNNYIADDEKKIKNILLNEYEISQGRVVLESLPRTLNLVLTSKCNLNCIMCENHKENIELSDKQFEDIIEILPYLQKLILRGGEVFLDKRLYNLLDEAGKNHINTEIVTNGQLLNNHIINKLLDNKVEVTFSIDSVDEKNYESIRVGGSFKKLLNNLKNFKELKKIKKSEILTRLTMVVMKRNYKEIENIIDFAKEYDFNEIYLLPVYGSYVGKEENFFYYGVDYNIIKELSIKKGKFKKAADRYLIKLNNRLPDIKDYDSGNDLNANFRIRKNISEKIIFTKQSDKKTGINNLFCFAPWQQMFLMNNNVAIPTCMCSFSLNNNEKGNKNESNFIIDKWNSAEMLEYRNRIVSNKYKEICIKDYLCSKYI